MDDIEFKSKKFNFATAKKDETDDSSNENNNIPDNNAAKIGTVTHEIIELYWENFFDYKESIFNKMEIFEQEEQDAIIHSMENIL